MEILLKNEFEYKSWKIYLSSKHLQNILSEKLKKIFGVKIITRYLSKIQGKQFWGKIF